MMKLMKFYLWKHSGDLKMNRYILGEIEKIFDTLKAHVDDDDKGRILNVKGIYRQLARLFQFVILSELH